MTAKVSGCAKNAFLQAASAGGQLRLIDRRIKPPQLSPRTN
jgi:hypothetical protein